MNNYLGTEFENSSFILNLNLININKNETNSFIITKSNDIFDANSLTYEPWLTVLIAIVAATMSSITIIGNVFVILAFIIDKNLRKYSNYFILNLSIADLLIGILIPPYAPFLLNKRYWRFGKVACTIWLVLDYVVGSASVLCIVVISLDRYLLVSKGLKYVAGQKVLKAILIMLTVWLIAFLNYAPAIIFWELISGHKTVKEGECQVAFHDNLVYLTATACVEFFAPFFSICGLNLAVYLNIRKRSRGLIRSENPQFNLDKNLLNSSNNNNNNNNNNQTKREAEEIVKLVENENKNLNLNLNSKKRLSSKTNLDIESKNKQYTASASSTTCSSSSIDETHLNLKLKTEDTKSNNKSTNKTIAQTNNNNTNNSSNKRTSNNGYSKIKKNSPGSSNRTLTKDKKAARSLFILVFVFVFCWAPYTFLTLIQAVCKKCINENLYEFAFWLLWFNSTLNPILYPFLHVKFRKAFLKIIQIILFCFDFKKTGYKRANQAAAVGGPATTNFINKKTERTPSNI